MEEDLQYSYEIPDEKWAVIEPILPGQRGQWGGIAQNNRSFINAVFWIMRTGGPWRNLPESYGKWGSVHQRFRRWCKNGTWEKVLARLTGDPDYEWLMIAANYSEGLPCESCAKDSNQT